MILLSRKKQQHIVPRLYLRNFCTAKNNEQLYFYDKVTKKRALTNINNIAQERDFYTDISQEDKYYYENYYSTDIEPLLGKLLSRIIVAATMSDIKIPILNKDDRCLLSKMVTTQMMRTRSARNLMREKVDIVTDKLISQLLKKPEIEKNVNLRMTAERHRVLDEDLFKEMTIPVFVDETQLKKYFDILDSMICTFFDNQTAEGFITSDNHVVIYRTSTQEGGLGKAGLRYYDCVIAYPINPYLTAAFVHRDSLYGYAFREYENRKCPIDEPEIVHTLNRLHFIQASRQVYSKNPINLSSLSS